MDVSVLKRFLYRLVRPENSLIAKLPHFPGRVNRKKLT
jgi:hypothetical protein